MKIMEAPHPKWGDMANRLGPASQALAARRFFSSSAEEGQHRRRTNTLRPKEGSTAAAPQGLENWEGCPPPKKTFNLHPT